MGDQDPVLKEDLKEIFAHRHETCPWRERISSLEKDVKVQDVIFDKIDKLEGKVDALKDEIREATGAKRVIVWLTGVIIAGGAYLVTDNMAHRDMVEKRMDAMDRAIYEIRHDHARMGVVK